jgi:hypothetical protein
MQRFTAAVAGAIYRSPRWRFVTVILAIALVKTGVWVQPNLDVTAVIARDPFSHHSGVAYLAENWLDPFLGWLVGARTWPSLAVLDLFFSAAFVAVMLLVLFRRLTDRSARTASLIFIALPVSMTSFYWIGLDSLTLLLMALALLAMRRWWVVVLVGIPLGMQHFEQGIASALLLAGANGVGILLRQRGWRTLIFPVALGVGVLIGRGALALIYAVRGITIDYDRVDWFHDNLDGLVRQYLENPLVIWFSVLGVAWLAVIRFAMLGRRSIPLLAAIAVLCAVCIIYSDQTRVACIIGLLVVATELLLDEDFLARITDPQVVVFALAWAVFPLVWVWGAKVQPAMLPYDVEVILNRLTGWPPVPTNPGWLYWPFLG